MSQYDYDDPPPRRHYSTRTRPRERRDPDFVQETTFIERGKGPPPRELVYRGPRDDDVEDIQRDFPPPNGERYRRDRDRGGYDSRAPPPRRARSAGRRDYDDDDRYSDLGPAAAGAAGGAAYAAARNRDRRGGDRRQERYDRDYDSEDYHSPRRRRDKKKSSGGVSDILEGLGLGGVAGALLGGGGNHSRSRSRDQDRRRGGSRARGHSSSPSRSRSRGDRGVTERKWAQATQAALIAGAVEAFRSRKDAGPWTGEKGRRIATAALGAAGIDGLVDRDPDKKTKRHLAEAVIGGLAANRLANGPRESEVEYDRNGRPRSRSNSLFGRGRSQSRGRDGQGGSSNTLKELATGGALAAAAGAIYDRVRSKSRRRRSPSSSSQDSYVPSRNRRRGNKERNRSPGSDTTSNRGGRGNRGGRPPAAARAGQANKKKQGGGGESKKGSGSSSSSSESELEGKRKHMRSKELLTAGLATIATIHAAHGVYSSMEAHEKRHRLVAEGEMSPEEARKKQTKAWVQDAAAVGIAALGIKGAFSEWKEMQEHRREIHELEKKKRLKIKKRQQREKQEKQEQMKMLGGGGAQMMYYPMPMYPPYGQGQGQGQGQYPSQQGGQMQYADGNPYAAR